MATSIPPTSDTGVRDWAANFQLIAGAAPTAIGLTAAMMTAYSGLLSDYLARLTAATDPSTKTKVSVQAKNTSKAALISSSRQLVKIADAFPGTTNTQRASLGMHIRDTGPTPRPAPTTQPIVSIAGSGGGQALLRLRDETTPDKKAKPAGVFGALLATAVTAGPEVPPNFAPGVFNAVVTRTDYTLPLPPASAGKTLWAQCQWINERGEPGPVSVVTSALIAA